MKRSLAVRVFVRLTAIPPVLAAIAVLTAGTLMFLLSVPLGISTLTCPSGKQAGFVYEINWFVNFMLILPAAFYLAGLTVTGIAQTIRNLATFRMIVGPNGQPLSPDEALESWYALGGKLITICGLLVLAALGQGMIEYYTHSYLPLAKGTVAGLSPEYSCTWGVAAAVHPGTLSTGLNQLFSFVMFVGQGAAASSYLSLVAVVLGFAYWIDRFNRRSDLPDLVPGLDSEDRRLGFEHLEPFVQNLFSAALVFAIALFAVRLQFLYFGSAGAASSVYSFIVDDVAAGFLHGAKALLSGDSALFDAGHGLIWSTIGSIAAFMILLVVSLMVVSIVLRQAAIRARDVFYEKRASLEALRPEIPVADQEKKLRRMTVWPLSYPGPIHLLLIMSFSATAFVAYKLTLIVIGIVGVLGAKRLLSIFGENKDNRAEAEAAEASPGRDA